MSLFGGISGRRTFWKWVFLVTLAGAGTGIGHLYYPAISDGIGAPLVVAGDATIQAIDRLPELWRQFVAGAASKEALYIYREVFAVLMFIFAARESIRLAIQAWRGFKFGRRERKARIVGALRLALILTVCAGPIGKHGMEMLPPSSVSDSV